MAFSKIQLIWGAELFKGRPRGKVLPSNPQRRKPRRKVINSSQIAHDLFVKTSNITSICGRFRFAIRHAYGTLSPRPRKCCAGFHKRVPHTSGQNVHKPASIYPSRAACRCESGYGSKLNRRGHAGFGPCFHLRGFRLGYLFLIHSQVRK